MRYGVITGRVDRDPCADLRGALTPVKTKNHAAITDPIKVGELLRAIDGYQGQPSSWLRLRPIAPTSATECLSAINSALGSGARFRRWTRTRTDIYVATAVSYPVKHTADIETLRSVNALA
jgi:hypothetical protein